VENIEKHIAGDWYELRSRLDTPGELVEYLELSSGTIADMRESLRLSVEEGVVEYKKGLVHSIMTSLKSLKWNSKAMQGLTETIGKAAMLILTPALQRQLALGHLRTSVSRQEGQAREQRKAEEARQSQQLPPIKEMVADVKQRMNAQPELKHHSDVNRIFAQLKYYNSQLEKMRNLKPGIPKEKQQSFLSNFQQTFQEIHERIYNAYSALLEEQKSPAEEKSSHTPILKRYELAPLESHFREQCREAARLYSTLVFAEEEGYRMRELLLDLVTRENYYISSYDQELEKYRGIAPFGKDYLQMSVAIARELYRYLERYTASR